MVSDVVMFAETEAMVLLERGERNIYIPIIKPLENPAAFANVPAEAILTTM